MIRLKLLQSRRSIISGLILSGVLVGVGLALVLYDNRSAEQTQRDAVQYKGVLPNGQPSAAQSGEPVPADQSSVSPEPRTEESPIVSKDEEAIHKMLEKFYAAYKNKDSNTLLVNLMTPPNSEGEKMLHNLLLKGESLDGVPGGPTLFISNVASAVVQGYVVESLVEKDNGWLVETRETTEWNNQTFARNRILEIVNLEETFLIDKYMSDANSGKYTGYID